MNSAIAHLPDDLAFLAQYHDHGQRRYRTAYWLLNDFDAEAWEILVGTRFFVDWRVLLSDGRLLTSACHSNLLNALKAWVVIQTHADTTNGRRLQDRVAYQRLRAVLHCIDYFLLRDETLGLSSRGFGSLTSNDVSALVGCLASSSHIARSVYRWPATLGSYLRSKADELSDEELEGLILANPVLAEHLNQLSGSLLLDRGGVQRARAWLWSKGLYEANKGRPSGYAFEFTPICPPLARDIYSNTLLGAQIRLPLPTDLCLRAIQKGSTERARAPITNRVDSRQETTRLRRYMATIDTLTYLKAHGFDAPKADWEALTAVYAACNLKEPGRFFLPPSSVVMGAMRAAIEFVLDHGDTVVDTYLAVLEEGRRTQRNPRSVVKSSRLPELLSDSATALGFATWGDRRGPNNVRRGVVHSMRVLYGAVALTVSALTARRAGELQDLVAMNCLSRCETYLRFENRKSATSGLREIEHRPIPPVAARCIQLIERCQVGLISLGFLDDFTYLFRNPTYPGTRASAKLGALIDAFCDFGSLPCNDNGERYYLRPHQLRRFFAQTFFWNAGLGSLESLRFFLGHSDPEQVYRYVTECTSGEALRSVKVEYAVECLRRTPGSHSDLKALVEEYFHTSNFELIDTRELSVYLARLMLDGTLVVTPEFLPGGRYRVLITVSSST